MQVYDKNDEKLTFDEKDHIYQYDTNNVYSVTQVIDAMVFKNQESQNAMERGRQVHRLCEQYMSCQNEKDEEKLLWAEDPCILGCFQGFLNYKKDLITQRDLMPRGIGEIKTGQPQKWHILQLAAYWNLWVYGIDSKGNPLRFTLQGVEVKGYYEPTSYAGTIDIVDIDKEDNDVMLGNKPKAFLLYLNPNGKYTTKTYLPYEMILPAREFLTLSSAKNIAKKYNLK